MNLSALILAAGKGSRIGKPKLMLEFKEKSFLSIIADNLKEAGIKNIFCVVSSEFFNWAAGNVKGVNYTVNPNPENGMISSVQIGLKETGNCDGVIIIPVDHPFVSTDTMKLLIESFCNNPDCLIKPIFKNVSGHPIIIPPELSKNILSSGINKTLDVVIKESFVKKIGINTDDSGVIKNINTTEDLKIG
jgi:molybdenum cofactor cytidylyltransferase